MVRSSAGELGGQNEASMPSLRRILQQMPLEHRRDGLAAPGRLAKGGFGDRTGCAAICLLQAMASVTGHPPQGDRGDPLLHSWRDWVQRASL